MFTQYVSVDVKKGLLASIKSDVLIFGVFENEFGSLKKISGWLYSAVSLLSKEKKFSGEQFTHHFFSSCSNMPSKNILVVGFGKRESFDIDVLRKSSALAARLIKDLGFKSFVSALHQNSPINIYNSASAVVEGALLALYDFTSFKTVGVDKIKKIDSFSLVDEKNFDTVKTAVDHAVKVCNAVYFTRDLVNFPPNFLTPEKLAVFAKDLSKSHKSIKVSVFDKKAIQKLGFNSLLAVNQGSAKEPRFIVLEYKKSSTKPIVLVGKGITFDSGGIDLKPAEGMEAMQGDMAGAAVVLGTFKAVAELNLPVNIVGLIPSTENLPDGNAYKPSDIVKSYSGKTIEINNTDAEGRVVLADALSYAAKFKPKAVIDLATLTGACVVALGFSASGLFSNNDELIKKFKLSAESTSERVWELPLYDYFKEAMKSDVADIRNLSTIAGGKYGGACTGAAFLQFFVDEKYPWVHLDIAPTFWSPEDKFYTRKYGTGYGVRLLLDFLKKFK